MVTALRHRGKPGAGFLLALLYLVPARADEVMVVIQFMPRSAVIERCSSEGLLAELGCVRWLPAVDNPNDLWCKVLVPRLEDRPWDEAALVERLRPQCWSER